MRLWFLLPALAVFLQAAPPASAMEKDDKEVLAALDSYKSAMLKRDAAALDKIFHKDLTYSHSNGKLESKAEAITAATTGTNITELMEFSDLKTRVYGNTALIRGDTRIKSNTNDLKLSVLYVWMKGSPGLAACCAAVHPLYRALAEIESWK